MVIVNGASIVVTIGIVPTSCGPGAVCVGSVLVNRVVAILEASNDTVVSIRVTGAIDIIGEGEVVSRGRLSGISPSKVCTTRIVGLIVPFVAVVCGVCEGCGGGSGDGRG